MRPLVRTLVAALAGVGAGLSFEPYHWAYLLPVCVAVLTLLCTASGPSPQPASRSRDARTGFWLGFVFGTAFMLVLLPWLTVIGSYAWVPLAIIEGLFYGLAGLATVLVARLPGWPLWAACSWVAVEGLRASFPFGGFPWGRLAFAAEDTPVAPVLAYVGAPGASFLIALVGTTLAWAVLRARRSPVQAAIGLVGAVVLATFAAVAPYPHTSAGETPRRITVAAVQGNVPGVGLEAFAERRAVLNNHVSATEALARRIDAGKARRPDLVLWPENSSDIDPYADLGANVSIADAVRAVRAPLLMGAVVGDRVDSGWYNRAILWSANGTPGAYYDKTHPVPFGEYIPLRSFLAPRVPALDQIPSDMVAGTRPGVLDVGPAKVGMLMCFEVAYDGLLRDLVDDGADVIVVPTNNATYTGTGQVEQQFAMSRLRAIETGRYVVVASTNGISGIVAPDGHVVERAPSREQLVLQREVSLLDRRTPATVLGAWPELLLAAVSLISVL
ncbi:MAG: apolipoprotein N-acyltransferase, partial [Nocardioidaceae bacterium]